MLVVGYQKLLSPLLPGRCRFYPCCSQYAKQALKIHSFARASRLILYRLVRCHPFHPGGIDEVPSTKG